MNNKLSKLMVCGMFAMAATASAQNTNSAYFLDNYTHRYELNPAFGNSMNFVGFPVLGNMNIAMNGSLHVTDFIQLVDGKSVLFTNPGVPMSVLDGFPETGKIGLGLKFDILSGGWKAWGGYNTVSINLRADANMGIPKTFFELAKEGISNRTYDISNMDMKALGYAEIALNHSRDIKQVPGLRVGAAMKFLLGVANLDVNLNRADLTLGKDDWNINADADVYANIGGFQYTRDTDNSGREYVSGMNLNGPGSIGVNGFGMSFDLGGEYQYRDFKFSLAVLDLGWLTYNNTMHASTNGVKTFNTDAYTFNVTDDKKDEGQRDAWDQMGDDLAKLYQLDDNGNIGSRAVNVGPTLNVGVDYTLPYYRRLHFGVLSSTRFLGTNTWSECRISANVNPVDCLSADVNVAFGTYGTSFGWLLNVCTKGFNMFVGMDHCLGKLSKQMIPLNSNASVNFGINFPF